MLALCQIGQSLVLVTIKLSSGIFIFHSARLDLLVLMLACSGFLTMQHIG